jgi:NIMA (never in mitosis gene a)-related kinase
MVTEFAEGGDLSSFINGYRKKKQMIPEEEIWRLSIQMIHALKTFHKKNIFHRDIKSANIFLTKNFQEVKVGDMNVSILSKSGMATTQTGTPYYTSP